MSGVFYGCELLLIIPDISKWKVNKVTNISNLFNFCYSLLSIPDISK